MDEKILERYHELKADNPNIDHDMVMEFLEEMPEEAMLVFDKMTYGCHIATADLYEETVKHLKWIDGKGSGPKWTPKDIWSLSGIDFDTKDYYGYDYAYVVNMLWSDYCNVFTEPKYYLEMAKNYLEDNDYCGKADERAYHNAVKRIEYSE